MNKYIFLFLTLLLCSCATKTETLYIYKKCNEFPKKYEFQYKKLNKDEKLDVIINKYQIDLKNSEIFIDKLYNLNNC